SRGLRENQGYIPPRQNLTDNARAGRAAFADVLDQGFGTIGGNADEQPSRRLGIIKEFQPHGVRLALNAQERLYIRGIRGAGARAIGFVRQTFRARQERQFRQFDDDRRLTSLCHFVSVPGQTKAGNIGGRVDADLKHGLLADIVELYHAGARRCQYVIRAIAGLVRRRNEAGAQRLGQHELVAGSRQSVRQNVLRMDDAGHSVAELDFGIADSVAAENDDAGRLAALRAATEDFAQPRQFRIFVIGIADYIEGG